MNVRDGFTGFPGKLFRDTSKSMMLVSLLIVITAVPRAVLSAFVTRRHLVEGRQLYREDHEIAGSGSSCCLLPHPAAPIARTVTAIANRFIRILLLSKYVKSKRQREDDCESDRAGIEIRQV